MRTHTQWAMVVALTGLLIVPFGFNQASANDARDFEEADLNGNGHVDRGEYHSRMMDRFYMLDDDRDGKLVPSELNFVDDRAFNKADSNGNGSLSSAEYYNSRFFDFVKADSNSDSVLDLTEVEAWPLD